MSDNIKDVCIIGAGFTGKQIAAQTALYNYIVHVFDIDEKMIETAKKYISGFLKRKNKNELIEKVHYYKDLSIIKIDPKFLKSLLLQL